MHPKSKMFSSSLQSRLCLLLASGLFVLVMPGCLADSHEGLVKSQIRLSEKTMKIMKSITDRRSAMAAAPKLEKIAKQMQDLDRRAKKLDQPDAETMQRIQKLRMDYMKKQMDNLDVEAMKNLSKPEVAEVLKDVMEKIQKQNRSF